VQDITGLWKMFHDAIDVDDNLGFNTMLEQLSEKKIEINPFTCASSLIQKKCPNCLAILFQKFGSDFTKYCDTEGNTLFHLDANMPSCGSCSTVLSRCVEETPMLMNLNKNGDTAVHIAYNNGAFDAGDLMAKMVNLSQTEIKNQEGVTAQTCRKYNRISQIIGTVVSGALFLFMMGATLYDAFQSHDTAE
jgi:ankyrin repeat protein